MQRGRSGAAALIVAVAFVVGPPGQVASGAESKDARSMSAEATTAFARGDYGEAGEKYEAAFALRPDRGLLYDAAQSYRLAGHRAHALELYRNYVGLYPDGANAADARRNAATLKKELDEGRPPIEVARAPSGNARRPSGSSPAPVAPLLAAQPPAASTEANDAAASLVAQPGAQGQGDEKPMTRQLWFWAYVGGGAALLGAMVFLFANRSDSYPDATFGTARGN